jgi:hypothetical protein
LQYDDALVWFYLQNRDKFQTTYQYNPANTNYLVVESVDGVVPTSNQHLYNLLKALLPQ